MIRDLHRLTHTTFDVLVVGGGIYGAALAWEATARGLKVALLERSDFASATSANSLKIIHGGFRYLQKADIGRMRRSIGERRALMRIAPHLVHPLPVLIPTYGHGLYGREALAAALLLNDLISMDRNRLNDPQKHIPHGQVLSAQECLQMAPGIERRGLTGGAMFYDAQVYNSERLVLAYLQSAADAGAAPANYIEAQAFLYSPGGAAVTGVRAYDRLSESHLDVHARQVVLAAGPWTGQLLARLQGGQGTPASVGRLAKAFNLVTRPLLEEFALGVLGSNGYETGQDQARKNYLFIAPWRGFSLLGTTYAPFDGSPDNFEVQALDVNNLRAAINAAYPGAELKRQDIYFVHAGLLPAGQTEQTLRLFSHPQVLDSRTHGVEGVLAVIGVKYTTARRVAVDVVRSLGQRLDRRLAPSVSARQPLSGGQIDNLEHFLEQAIDQPPYDLTAEAVRRLVYNYGSNYPEVLRYWPGRAPAPQFTHTPAHVIADAQRAKGNGRSLAGISVGVDQAQALIQAQVRYAVYAEMAETLADVILRRTDLGSAGHPGRATLELSAAVMAEELGWSRQREIQEISALEQIFALPDR